MKITSLQDLKKIQKTIADAAALKAAQQAAELEKQRRLAAQKNLFIHAAGAVHRIPDKRKALLKKEQPAPVATQLKLDEQAVLVEAISDGFDASSLLETDETLSYRRPGIGIDVLQRLRKGEWTIQRQLDLHGLRSDAARDALSGFIRDAHKHGIRCVRVVHGKGLSSPGKTPVLKAKVRNWLVQKNEVLAFVQARPMEGGAGALVVLLRPS
ncbi:DNA-nicking Smr family endonuclease [Rhodoferax ferrireducens]|uniref:DNA-nicking Smr family endonuclease n=1 Tax=Rhodoferax ferrireducens TaxID=192843 RepID=A0ABU2C3Z9_9BURK|nr:Smr/MutS family protein [Rhodoferax ferrireducens]MDR7376059.1 DNA-nicking Smr family endonuclease [Rhodoferax ferrireducens]